MKKGFDIYNFDRRIQLAEKAIEKAPITQTNKETILKFRDNCILEGISTPRTEKYMTVLKNMAKIIKADFDKATKEDIIRLIKKKVAGYLMLLLQVS